MMTNWPPGRFDNLERVLTLDPQADNQEIVFLVGAYEYPWLMRKTLEFALFRTFAAPRIGALLDQSQQFSRAGQKRYDDTSLLIAEFTENGYDSVRGRAAIRQMNRVHRRFPIENDDYLYVLSTFIYEPDRWHRRYGWRQPTHHENLANFHFWTEVGRRMGIQDVPDDYAAFEQFNRDYEARHFRYTDASRRVADATIAVFLDWYPALLRPLVRQFVLAFMDEPLQQAFNYPRAHPLAAWLAKGGLWLLGRCVRWMPPRRQPFRLTEARSRTYPDGYRIEGLGSTEP